MYVLPYLHLKIEIGQRPYMLPSYMDMLYCFDNMIGDKQNLNRGLKCYEKENMHNKIIYSTSVVFLETVLYNLIEKIIMVYPP